MTRPTRVPADTFTTLRRLNDAEVEVDTTLGGYVITTRTGRKFFTPFPSDAELDAEMVRACGQEAAR